MKPETLPQEIVDLLLPRLQDEFTALYFYREATNWCRNAGYMKAADFFKKESDSELEHAKGIEDFITDWNVQPDLPSIETPVTFTGLIDIINKAYQLEFSLYAEYEDTSVKIFRTGDICVFDFLQKYRKIQNDSVVEYSDILNKLEGVKEDKFQLLMLEDKLFS